MTNPRIEEIVQQILTLARTESEYYSGINGEWAREVIQNWEEQGNCSELLMFVKNILETGYQDGGYGYHFGYLAQTQIIKLFNEWRDILMAELEEKVATLENEVNTHLEALQTGQTWHEQQKRELNEKIANFEEQLSIANQTIEEDTQQISQRNQTIQEKSTQLTNTLQSLHDLQQENQTLIREKNNLNEKNEELKQRILALEADKSDLISQLTEQKNKWTQHIEQTKQQLNQEIALIKEALID